MGFLKRYRDLILVILLIALPFFFLRASISRPEELSSGGRVMMRMASPLQFFSSAVARVSSDLVGRYVYLVDVRRDNDRLHHEVLRLQNEARELSRVRLENERLRKLLGLRETLGMRTVSAVVTTKSPTEFFRVDQLILDPGVTTVKENQPVISLQGAVGVIRRVAGEAATVQLVADAGFGVDVIVSRTRARGFVRGTGDDNKYTVRVENVERTDEVEVGDLLVTSGAGCRFPPDIAVARVTEVVKRDFGSYQTVSAEPTVDFSRLEEVLIIADEPKDCHPDGGP